MLADDLKTLLERSEVRPPYILVPSSIGGLTAEMFARRYPDRVAGLVFLDAANSDSGIVERASSASTIQREAVCLARIAARLGLVRIADPLGFRTLPRGTADRAMAQTYRADTVDTACALVRGIPQSVQELREAPPLRSDVPLTVLIAETAGGLGPPALQPQAEALAAAFHESQKRFARRSTRGSWRIVPNSDHLIASRQPQAVSSAVLGMLNEVRRTAHPR
jgi:pimeloyl-ACP methyl ester carboxylesterase